MPLGHLRRGLQALDVLLEQLAAIGTERRIEVLQCVRAREIDRTARLAHPFERAQRPFAGARRCRARATPAAMPRRPSPRRWDRSRRVRLGSGKPNMVPRIKCAKRRSSSTCRSPLSSRSQRSCRCSCECGCRRRLAVEKRVHVARRSRVRSAALRHRRAPSAAQTPTTQGIANWMPHRTLYRKLKLNKALALKPRSGKSVVVHYTGWLYDTSKPIRTVQSSTARAIATTRSGSRSVPAR